MCYQFFLCKPSPYAGELVARSLRRYRLGYGHRIDWQDGLVSFDVGRLNKLLRIASGEAAGFSPKFTFLQVPDLPFVSVWTSYRMAQEVADALAVCAGGVEATVFDGEMDCLVDVRKRDRAHFIAARLAHQRLRVALQKHPRLSAGLCGTQATYCKLGEYFSGDGFVDTAIMVLRGDMCDAVKAVDDVLRAALSEGEVLYCSCGCFVVENREFSYKVRFVVEGSGKSAQYMGWVENGKVHLELLRRMSLYRALKAVSAMDDGEVELIRSRLYFREAFATRGELRNPADRFVDSYKMSKRFKKLDLDIVYGHHPLGNRGEYKFYFCGWHNLGWDAWKGQSCFSMAEDDANLLMAIFESVVPYYCEYYYDDFHFRKEETDQILAKIGIVRQEVLKDPGGQSLGMIGQRLFHTSFAYRYPDGRISSRFDEEKFDILRENRFRIVALLDFFSWWLRGQGSVVGSGFHGFHIVGP